MGELKDMIGKSKSTRTHSFIKCLHDSRKLLRCYTQNIDDLEVGVTLNTNLNPNPKQAQVVQLHGTMSRVVCSLAPANHTFEFSSEYISGFKTGEPPNCPRCLEIQKEKLDMGKRLPSLGYLRPDIVLYNEHNHRDEVIGSLQCHDLRKRPDFLLVMGTSLKVPGCKRLVKEAAKAVHSAKGGIVVFVNLDEVAYSEWESVIDYHFLCETDVWVDKIEPLFLKQLKEKALPSGLPLSKSDYIPRSKIDILSETPSPFPGSPLNLALDDIIEGPRTNSPSVRGSSGLNTKPFVASPSLARCHSAIPGLKSPFNPTNIDSLCILDEDLALDPTEYLRNHEDSLHDSGNIYNNITFKSPQGYKNDSKKSMNSGSCKKMST